MPRSAVKASPALEIQIDDGRTAWAAGDVITGRVSRCAPLVSAQATITIYLLGRAKSKMIVNRGQAGTVIYRNRFNFFPPEQSATQLVSGPIHIPDTGDMHSWQFSVTIPSQLDPATVASKNQQKFSYLPLGYNEISRQPMPPSFYCKGVWFNISYEAYNEYFLEAEISIESGGSFKTENATVPVNVLARSTPGPTSEFHPSRFAPLCQLNSHRLVPGAENSSLTFQQRTQHLFRSSKVPQYAFSLQVDCPRVLQIGNPTPIPFKLLAVPERAHTTDVLQDCHMELTLTSVQFEIRARTEILCRGTLASHDVRGNRKLRLVSDDALGRLGQPVIVPLGQKAEPLDVGKALGLSLDHLGPDLSATSSSKLANSLYPTFNTYNIQHSHKLTWKIEISSAGATTKISDEVDLTLLPLLPTSDAPPYTPYVGPLANQSSYKEGPYQEETIPSYAEAVPSSSNTDDFIPEKAKLKQ